jgi:hypothetical protein
MLALISLAIGRIRVSSMAMMPSSDCCIPSAQRTGFDNSKSLSTQESKPPSLRGPHSSAALRCATHEQPGGFLIGTRDVAAEFVMK